MADLNARLKMNREAVEELISIAESSASNWSQARAPGKWSPAQLVEHVARTLEECANVVAGRPAKFPTFPVLVRPIVRALLFNRVLKHSKFPKARTNRAMNPESGPASPQDARLRLDAACCSFEGECLAYAQRADTLQTGLFGKVSIGDYVRFTELHTRHHITQLPRPQS